MADSDATPSARRSEPLEAAYRYVLAHGLAEMSLRPLAKEIGSSPRVLLYLFGSKEGLVRALLARARSEELALLAAVDVPASGPPRDRLPRVAAVLWAWLSDPARRALLTLWLEGYVRSLVEPSGPWADFARETVADWLDVLAAAQPGRIRDTDQGRAERTRVLAVLRGALIDLLATGEDDRVGAAIRREFGAPALGELGVEPVVGASGE
ncbi:TetR/AcrR family transcriptional regulator [Nocardia jinanensis]|uniref:TetR family transcriptional regulator n=1 Tax=Nocardia jinanensis TaxID=382504 RepID=A0A917RH39_9NOCA|nr:TetR/AcrR family transcriptional regulator [Nocardia jinanensis]GGL07133.1 TetR family transcriptional regulator [Nocardia jinanensis]